MLLVHCSKLSDMHLRPEIACDFWYSAYIRLVIGLTLEPGGFSLTRLMVLSIAIQMKLYQ
jgi:hypothetical protein